MSHVWHKDYVDELICIQFTAKLETHQWHLTMLQLLPTMLCCYATIAHALFGYTSSLIPQLIALLYAIDLTRLLLAFPIKYSIATVLKPYAFDSNSFGNVG